MKQMVSRDPIVKMERKLAELHRIHRFTPDEKSWVEEHRKRYEKESAALQLRFMQEEYDHIANG